MGIKDYPEFRLNLPRSIQITREVAPVFTEIAASVLLAERLNEWLDIEQILAIYRASGRAGSKVLVGKQIETLMNRAFRNDQSILVDIYEIYQAAQDVRPDGETWIRKRVYCFQLNLANLHAANKQLEHDDAAEHGMG